MRLNRGSAPRSTALGAKATTLRRASGRCGREDHRTVERGVPAVFLFFWRSRPMGPLRRGVMDPRWTAALRTNLRPLPGVHLHAPYSVGASSRNLFDMTTFFVLRSVAAKIDLTLRAALAAIAAADRAPGTAPAFWYLHGR